MNNVEYIPVTIKGRIFGETIPVSIGTALALEVLINDHDLQKKYDSIYINIRTVFRNLIGSFEKAPTKLDTGKVLDYFIEELNELNQLRLKYLDKGWSVILYFPTYTSLRSLFKKAKLRVPTTTIQKSNELLEQLAFTKMKKEFPHMVEVDTKIYGNHAKSLILTHYPIDLFSITTFRDLALLESHTGAIKLYPKWSGKISSKEEYVNLPFNLLTLQVIGDGKLFYSMGRVFTKALLELADKGNWTAITTKDKVKFDISRMKDRFAAGVFLEMLTISLK